MKLFGEVWRLFLADNGFAASLLGTFLIAGLLKFVFAASFSTVLAVIALGCLTALAGAKISRDKDH